MRIYIVTDGIGPETKVMAPTPERAARQYVLDGDWPNEAVYGDRDTHWDLKVWTDGADADDAEWYRVATTTQEIPNGCREHE